MKHFWALPACLRLALASQHQFNVFDDLLAFPQYEVIIADSVISEETAQHALEALESRKSAAQSGSISSNEPRPSSETSLYQIHRTKSGGEQTPFELEDDVLTYEDMLLHDRRYLCSIPRIPESEDGANSTKVSREEEEKELVRATTRGSELLKSLEGSCLYFYSGWWSYSFCHGEGVRQFHQLPPGKGTPIYPPTEDINVPSYLLGRFDKPASGKAKKLDGKTTSQSRADPESGLARLQTKGETRYLVQTLKGGTVCDLTGRERKIEVQFRCQPNSADRISMIKETTTCQYLMVIDTPRLCNDVAFLPPQETKPHAIACTPVLPASSIPSYLAATESQTVSQDELLALQIDQEIADAINLLETGEIPRTHTREIVGGIEIGAQKFISADKVMERGAIVGGGKEKHLATVAKSDGWVAVQKELSKFGINNPKDLDDIKRKLNEAADGKEWKLDVVETPRGGWELRGIIDTGEDKKGDKKKKKVSGGQDLAEDDEKRQYQDEQEEGSEETYKEEL